MRIKNLKYDPNHADRPRRAYNHLKYLDDVITIEKARRVEAYERVKYGKPVSVEVIGDKKTYQVSEEKPKRKYTKRDDPNS